MSDARHPAHIIYLNGASSAGKTSIGRQLQQVLDEPHLLAGIDTFISMMPSRLFGTAEGWRFVPDGAGALRADLGAFAERALGAMYGAAAAMVRSGNNVIFDDVLTLPRMRDRLLQSWRELPVTLVGVRCDATIAEAREMARGNRAIGLARGSSGRVHGLIEYDIEVDSGTASAAECAESIRRFLVSGEPRAFARLCARQA